MTTIEMIDKIANYFPTGSAAWYQVMDLRARVESELAALQAVVEEIHAGIVRVEGNDYGNRHAEYSAGAIAAYRDALQEIAEKTGVRHIGVDCGTSIERVLTEVEVDAFEVRP